MNEQKQLEEIVEGKNSKQWQIRDKYCLRIQKATQYKGDCDHEDVPSILVDYEKEIKKELIPENAVVLSREEYGELKQAKTLLEFREETIKLLEDANIRYAEALELQVNIKERKEMVEKIDNYLVKRINEKFEQLKKEQELPVIREAIVRGMLYVRNAEQEICKEITEGEK